MLTSFAQILVQSVGFICGILIIRVLPTEEYALYTLANTMLGTMASLVDGGIFAGVMAEGGKVWSDQQKLGSVIKTGIYLRKRFALATLLVTSPVLFYLLHYHGASWLTSSLIVLSLIPAFYAALSGRMLEIVPKLHQDVVSLQRIQVLANVWRLGLLGLTIFVFPWAYVAVLAGGISQVWANIQIRKQAKKFIDPQAEKVKEVQTRILKLVKRMMPDAIYYVFSGQIMIWLVSIFGSTENIAQIGALTRFMVALSVVQAVLGMLVVPHFAKIQDKKKTTIQLFGLLQVGLLVFTALTTLFVWTFPNLLLSILGSQYSDLSYELVLAVFSSCIVLQVGVTHHVISSVGIVPPPILLIPFVLIFQVSLIFMFDFSVVAQTLLYATCISVATLLFHTTYFLIRRYKLP